MQMIELADQELICVLEQLTPPCTSAASVFRETACQQPIGLTDIEGLSFGFAQADLSDKL